MNDDKRSGYLVKRLTEMKAKRQPYEDLWDDVIEYTHPRRVDYKDESKVTGGEKVYNAIGIHCQKTHVDGLMGYMVSAGLVWFKLGLEKPQYENIPMAKEFLELAEKQIYKRFQASNFYDAIGEGANDATAIGSCVIAVEDFPEERNVSFSARHPKECYFAENRRGTVDTIYREVYMQGRDILEEFGKKLSEESRRKYNNAPLERYCVVHAVIPWKDWEKAGLDEGDKVPVKPNEKHTFASVWMLQAEQEIVKEGGFETFPFVVWRYKKNSYETYGRGPGMEALYDLITVNQLSKANLKAAQKMVDPPLMVPGSMKNKIKDYPGGRTYVERMGHEEPKPLYTIGNYNLSIEREMHFEQKIKDTYMVDFFFAMQNARVQMTATEALERQGEKAAILGSMIGRMSAELLSPIIKRCFHIEMKHNRIPEAPPELAKILGGKEEIFKIEFIGPLASLQKKHLGSQGYTKGLGTIANLAQFKPEIIDILKFDEVARAMLQNDGLSAKAIRTEEEYNEIMEIKAKQAQELQSMQLRMAMEKHQSEMAQGQAEVAKDMATTQQNTSPMAGLMSQMGGG